ncbi:MAG: FlgD immunoglobulin-like domain containing protein [Candidatus Zixiibacteriota bacterium]
MAINNFRLTLVLTVLISLFLASLVYGLHWPIRQGGNVQQRVSSTFGEFRHTSGNNPPYDTTHFHDGVDIVGFTGTSVFGAESTYIDRIWDIDSVLHHVRTWYHDYFHIIPDANIEEGDNAGYDVLLGHTDSKCHLHFTCDPENDTPPHWGTECNPLLQSLGSMYALQPFSDTSSPVIHFNWISVVKDETNQTFTGNVIRGCVDILVWASDSTSCSDPTRCPDPNNGIYKVSYWIPNAIYTPITYIIFDSDINQWDMDYVYAEGSDLSIYKYKVTNYMDLNNFWNTNKAWDGEYIIHVKVCDQSDNCVEDTTTVIVDNTTEVEETEDIAVVPERFSLSQNYPNPFNPDTKIDFSIPRNSKVRLSIYNVMGQRIKTLVDETKTAGYYDVIWDGRNEKGKEVASGTYIYKLEADDFKETKKMILLK